MRWPGSSRPASMNKTEPPPPQHKRLERALRTSTCKSERAFPGIAVCAGIGIGPVFRAHEPPAAVARTAIEAAQVTNEAARLDAAIAQSRKQLAKLRTKLAVLPEESQAEIAPLLDAYLHMLGPSRLVRGAKRR